MGEGVYRGGGISFVPHPGLRCQGGVVLWDMSALDFPPANDRQNARTQQKSRSRLRNRRDSPVSRRLHRRSVGHKYDLTRGIVAMHAGAAIACARDRRHRVRAAIDQRLRSALMQEYRASRRPEKEIDAPRRDVPQAIGREQELRR